MRASDTSRPSGRVPGISVANTAAAGCPCAGARSSVGFSISEIADVAIAPAAVPTMVCGGLVPGVFRGCRQRVPNSTVGRAPGSARDTDRAARSGLSQRGASYTIGQVAFRRRRITRVSFLRDRPIRRDIVEILAATDGAAVRCR